MQFAINKPVKGHWEVTFTDGEHAYLQCPQLNVGTLDDFPLVRGQFLYSTFHFYLINGRWTCKHPTYTTTHIIRVDDRWKDPTAGMEKILIEAVESQFHNWAIQQQDALHEARINRLCDRASSLREKIDDLQKEIKKKEAELEVILAEEKLCLNPIVHD